MPFAGEGGYCRFLLHLPNRAWLLRSTFGSQWVDFAANLATSNGVLCTIASVATTLGMSTVQGPLNAATGAVLMHTAHVVRFE